MSAQMTAGLVRVSDVLAHPSNVRRDLGDLRALTASIARDGVLVPVSVERRGDTLRLRDGHRRLAAAKAAGLTRIPAVVHPEPLDEDEWLVQAVACNELRKGLARVATAQRMHDAGITTAGIAAAFGVTQQAVYNWLNGRTRSGGPSGQRLAAGRVRALVAEYRQRPDATVADVLDALEALIPARYTARADEAES